jgi:hypothetical protein
MFEESGMSNYPPERPDEPDDDGLGRLFAAQDAAISDDGFTDRVMAQAHSGAGLRRTIIYGAGMAGFGAAMAGIVEMAPHLPNWSLWWGGMASALETSAVPQATNPILLILAAVVAGVSFLAFAVVAQER